MPLIGASWTPIIRHFLGGSAKMSSNLACLGWKQLQSLPTANMIHQLIGACERGDITRAGCLEEIDMLARMGLFRQLAPLLREHIHESFATVQSLGATVQNLGAEVKKVKHQPTRKQMETAVRKVDAYKSRGCKMKVAFKKARVSRSSYYRYREALRL